jgi:acid phosphatase family membrane protein YuiD
MTSRLTVFRSFFENPVFLSAISSWFLAQTLKALIIALQPRRHPGRSVIKTFFWETGGMPSSHAALVTAMALAVAFRDGFSSDLFVVSFFLAMIVIRDAMGVRRSSGIQARTLNVLGKQAAEKMEIEYLPVKEVYGHTPLEVAVGSLLGIFIACAYFYL